MGGRGTEAGGEHPERAEAVRHERDISNAGRILPK